MIDHAPPPWVMAATLLAA